MAANASNGLAEARNQVKKLLEWQRHARSKHAATQGAALDTLEVKNKPTVDVRDVLRMSFEVLLQKQSSDHAAAGSTTESDAFQVVSMAVQLQQFELSEDVQTDIAELVYRLWPSTSPGVVCRSLLEAMLARKTQDSAVFVHHLLRILQQTFTIGNKRSLQILIYIFDVVDEQKLAETFPDLKGQLAQCISSQSGAQQAARILGKLAVRKTEGDPLRLLEYIKPFVAQDTYRAKQAIHENLLPPLFSQVPQLQKPLLDWLRTEASTSADHLFALLSLARISLSQETASPAVEDQFDDLIGTSIVHEDPLIRFEAFRLLSSSPAGTAPSRRFDLHHLTLHTMFWKYNLTDSDSPAARTGLIGEWKHFIMRARLSSNAARRIVIKYQKMPESKAVPPEAKEAQTYLDAVEAFLKDWVKYAVAQLLPVKPYRCQIASLTFVQILLESNIDHRYQASNASKASKAKEVVSWPFQIEIITPDLIEELVTCIRSTYDDVRNIACSILASAQLEASQIRLVSELGFLLVQRKREADIASATLYLRLASNTMSLKSSANDEFDAVNATIPKLLNMLEARLQAFKENFSEAADQSPVHGILQAIANLLQNSFFDTAKQAKQVEALSRRCVKAIYEVWEITRPILCRGDLDAAEDAEDVGAEDSVVLNASWRAIKEASNLLSVLLALPLSQSKPIWTADELSTHASLFATWLLEIGHRGVFAHVSNAYSRLCTVCVRSKGPEGKLPAIRLKLHLVDILDKERPFARRSAGLPYLLLGVISCFPAQSNPLKDAFQRLINTASPASRASDVIRTHAIHCFRVLLLDGKLAIATKPYIQAAFAIAIPGFGNKHWGVRNASLLLYASLIQRLFSNKKENHLPLARRTSIVDFFSQYEGLVPDLVDALSLGIGKSEPEALGSVFSVLLLLSLLAMPGSSSRACDLASFFYPLVDACASSAVWKVRETAAAALTGLVAEADVYSHCAAILRACEKVTSSNELHGRLMQVQALLASHLDSVQHLDRLEVDRAWTEILDSLDRVLHRDRPLPVLTQALEIPTLSPTLLSNAISAKLHSLACRHYGQRRPGYETYNKALTSVLLKTEPERYIEKCLASPYPAAQAEALAYLMRRPIQNISMHHVSLQDQLLEIATSTETTITNRTAAIEALAVCVHSEFGVDDIQVLIKQYTSNDVPAIRQALLPLLANAIERSAAVKVSAHFIRQELGYLACDESSTSREAACKAMISLRTWLEAKPFRYGYQLLQFLQDDDLDVRILAGRVASRQYGQQQSLCTSRAIGLIWHNYMAVATTQDAQWLVQQLSAQLVQTTGNAEAGSQLLFAVERANMHIDITTDLSNSANLLAQHDQPETLFDETTSAQIASCRQRLDNIANSEGFSIGPADQHEIRNAYTFVQATFLARTLCREENA